MVSTYSKPDTRCDLVVWVIYAKPKDFPDKFVVRRWCGLAPDEKPVVCNTLEQARRSIPRGLYRLEPFANDDPVIVETWL